MPKPANNVTVFSLPAILHARPAQSLDEVIVTATRSPVAVMDYPDSATCIGADAVEPGLQWRGASAGLDLAAFGPLIGGATFLALLVAGQMIAALAIDHHGVLGFPVGPVDGWRIAGALLVITGVFLVARRQPL